jgi:hypothetical protein
MHVRDKTMTREERNIIFKGYLQKKGYMSKPHMWLSKSTPARVQGRRKVLPPDQPNAGSKKENPKCLPFVVGMCKLIHFMVCSKRE